MFRVHLTNSVSVCFSLRAEKQFACRDPFQSAPVKPAPPRGGGREADGSSAESGDSEIELVSEDPPKAASNPFAEAQKSKAAGGPLDNPLAAKSGFGLAGNHAPPSAYSILREEREAELDSDLFIESASEESPKREQGLSGPKPGAPPPSPLLPSTAPPRSAAATVPAEPPTTDKMKSPVKLEEDHLKPKPPTAAVPPEVRADNPPEDVTSKHGNKELEKTAAFILHGFNKQKGEYRGSHRSIHLNTLLQYLCPACEWR